MMNTFFFFFLDSVCKCEISVSYDQAGGASHDQKRVSVKIKDHDINVDICVHLF